MAVRISEKLIRELEPPKAGNRIVYDDPKQGSRGSEGVRGFGVRITAAGTRSFVLNYRVAGRERRHTIGGFPEISVEKARKIAGGLRAKIRTENFDPRAEREKERAPTEAPETFKVVAENFLKRHVRKEGQKDATPLRSAYEIERQFKKYLYPAWENRAFLSIRRGDVARLLDDLEDNSGPVMADRVLATLGKLFNWYASREDDYSSPIAKGMGRANARERARKRILSDDEIRALWKAADGTFGAFVKLLLLSAQRRMKVLTIKWDDVAKDGTWTIPTEAREKTNPGVIKLSKQALAVIKSCPKVNDNPYVFAGAGKKAINAISADKRRLDEAAQIAPWKLHDLRRTAKSLMARAGVRPDISERVLGHVIGGVEGVYDRHDYANEKAEALRKLAGLVDLILNPPANNVRQIRGAA